MKKMSESVRKDFKTTDKEVHTNKEIHTKKVHTNKEVHTKKEVYTNKVTPAKAKVGCSKEVPPKVKDNHKKSNSQLKSQPKSKSKNKSQPRSKAKGAQPKSQQPKSKPKGSQPKSGCRRNQRKQTNNSRKEVQVILEDQEVVAKIVEVELQHEPLKDGKSVVISSAQEVVITSDQEVVLSSTDQEVIITSDQEAIFSDEQQEHQALEETKQTTHNVKNKDLESQLRFFKQKVLGFYPTGHTQLHSHSHSHKAT